MEHRVENIGHIRCIDSKKTKIINRDHQQDQKSTVQNSAGTQLSVPSCFPFSDIASLGKVVTEGLAPLLYQMVICLYPLSEFRKMHWTHSFRKAKDRKFENLKICLFLHVTSRVHTHMALPEGRATNLRHAPDLYVVIDMSILILSIRKLVLLSASAVLLQPLS